MTSTWQSFSFEKNLARDGDGREIKRSQRNYSGGWSSWETAYFVNSSVIADISTETTGTGKRRQTFIVGFGSVVAKRISNDLGGFTNWSYRDPSGFSTRASDNDEELDALGNNVGSFPNSTPDAPDVSPKGRPTWGPETVGECELDGILMPCSMVERAISSESVLVSERIWTPKQKPTYKYHELDESLVALGLRRFFIPREPNGEGSMPELGHLPEVTSIGGVQGEWYSFGNASFVQENSCNLMVRMLQGTLNLAIKNFGGIDAFVRASHDEISSVVDDMDGFFSGIYSGRQLKTVEDAVSLGPTSIGGEGPKLVPAPYGGQSGFKPEFRQGDDMNNDQTHHFATYFSGGVNGMSLAIAIHTIQDDNEADIRMGAVAYSLGNELRKKSTVVTDRTNPRFPLSRRVDERTIDRARRVLGVAERVRRQICE